VVLTHIKSSSKFGFTSICAIRLYISGCLYDYISICVVFLLSPVNSNLLSGEGSGEGLLTLN